MTISIKIINEDTNTTRSVQVDTSENGATAPTVLIPAGGDETFVIHGTKQLTISELQHPEAEKESLVEKIVDAVKGEVESLLGLDQTQANAASQAAPAPEAPTPAVEAPVAPVAPVEPTPAPETPAEAPAAPAVDPVTEPAATPAA
jgi:hypothetical protein